MKIPKKLVAILFGAATTATPLLSDALSEKLREKVAKKEKEKIYENQKHNGMVKYASILFSLVALFLSILAIKQSKLILFAVCILSVIAYVITFLHCLEIISENKHNVYKIFFIIGNMLLVITITLFFF